jgi:hypothetical protein
MRGELIASPHRPGARSGPRDDLCVDAIGLELHTALSSADTDDSLLFEPLLETNLGVRGYRHRHGVESSCRVGWVRWIVERAVFWLLRFTSACATTARLRTLTGAAHPRPRLINLRHVVQREL